VTWIKEKSIDETVLAGNGSSILVTGALLVADLLVALAPSLRSSLQAALGFSFVALHHYRLEQQA
jgi:hypothetical protein